MLNSTRMIFRTTRSPIPEQTRPARSSPTPYSGRCAASVVAPDHPDRFWLDGRRNGPPEDCGGVSGYEELLEVIKNPDHEEYEHYSTWVGDDFEPEYFNLERVNAIFQRSKFYKGKHKMA